MCRSVVWVGGRSEVGTRRRSDVASDLSLGPTFSLSFPLLASGPTGLVGPCLLSGPSVYPQVPFLSEPPTDPAPLPLHPPSPSPLDVDPPLYVGEGFLWDSPNPLCHRTLSWTTRGDVLRLRCLLVRDRLLGFMRKEGVESERTGVPSMSESRPLGRPLKGEKRLRRDRIRLHVPSSEVVYLNPQCQVGSYDMSRVPTVSPSTVSV